MLSFSTLLYHTEQIKVSSKCSASGCIVAMDIHRSCFVFKELRQANTTRSAEKKDIVEKIRKWKEEDKRCGCIHCHGFEEELQSR